MSDIHAPNPCLVIVDSSAILKSCFEGYPNPLASSYKGKVMEVQALHGYIHRTMRMYEMLNFDCLVHVMDPPGGSHYRYSIYPEYKAGRKEEDPTLAAQKALLQRTLEAFGERVILKRGAEADDVISTLANKASAMGYQVLIVSPDKDLMQMVSNEKNIFLAKYVDDPATNRKTYSFYEETQVEELFGVRADQVADYLAIVGDSADNIPGIHKAGPKTAAGWLNKYGDLLTLMTHANEIGGKIGDNLREALPHLPLYQKLTTALSDLEGVEIPERPAYDEEKALFFKEVLRWPDDRPLRFEIPGDYAPEPTASYSSPSQAVVEPAELDMPAHDPLTQPAPGAGLPNTLGQLFEDSPFGDEPFGNEPFGGSSVEITREVTVTETLTVSAPAPAPSPRPGMRPGRIR